MICEEKPGMASIYSVDSRTSCSPLEFHCATIKTASKCQRIIVHTVTLSSPSPVISCVESLPQGAHVSHIPVGDSEHGDSKSNTESTTSQVLRDVHISTRLMEDFLELAKENTDKDLETCGILGAFLERGTFFVTTLIIPKQESTSSSCQAINEEEAFAIQNERSLLPVGWIHTHPSQSCFMSSVDLHTQYSYQVMVPEAFAIVMAPTDTSRSYGIFRVSDPGGMSVLKECQENGFHPHEELADGSPIYEHCSYVYKNSNLRFEIFDLR
ncbi:AMSH-like ubiquitin thioesterase 2 isoform X2 [Alnus glutinosa]|uniref:AMSH-like ubiquitin thioesterase 2 isoform X2 n=1 Tax=Alnus glutinosa TaxID=3517 RepID=UPI002D79071B|nr:AMSH-like ubiquitin thioesterase 2 isoform X2 [Alnus glutinosa]